MVQQRDARISVKSYIEEVKSFRTDLLKELIAATSAADLTIKQVFDVDVPFKGILKVVDDEHADMLVMGTKGRGNLADVLFGSTAEKVFRRCPVSLLSVRSKTPA
jgi:nucleotide-binding universal stress UspA family protein